jgi:hypothetical protein
MIAAALFSPRLASYALASHVRARRSRLWRGALATLCATAVLGQGAAGATTRHAGASHTFSGLEVRSPAGWSAHRYGVYCHFYGPDLLLANVPTTAFTREHDPPGCSDGLNVSRAPAGFVALELSIFTGPTPPMAGPSAVIDSKYPPSLEGMARIPASCRCVFRATSLWLSGRSYSLRAWVGKAATPASVRELNQALASIVPALVPGASKLTPQALKAFARKLAHKVYWAGALPGLTYELRNNATGTYVRYLPRHVPAGSAFKYLTIATIPLSDAYSVTKTEAQEDGTAFNPGHRGIAFSGTEPSGSYVWIAFPGFQYQIVVSGTSPAQVRTLVTSGAVAPIPRG